MISDKTFLIFDQNHFILDGWRCRLSICFPASKGRTIIRFRKKGRVVNRAKNHSKCPPDSSDSETLILEKI